MIGNDVVDLAAAKRESNWQRKGFMEKLFSMKEQQIITNYPDPETMMWVLWSMKEAAYKIYNRETGIRSYIPHKLYCTITSSQTICFKGRVYCEGFEYFTQTSISGESLHTVAVADSSQKIHEPENPEIIKDERGLPFIYYQNKLLPVSVSHHGRYRRVVSVIE